MQKYRHISASKQIERIENWNRKRNWGKEEAINENKQWCKKYIKRRWTGRKRKNVSSRNLNKEKGRKRRNRREENEAERTQEERISNGGEGHGGREKHFSPGDVIRKPPLPNPAIRSVIGKRDSQRLHTRVLCKLLPAGDDVNDDANERNDERKYRSGQVRRARLPSLT